MILEINDAKTINLFSKYIVCDDPFLKCFGYYIDNKLVSFIAFSILYDRAELNYIWTDEVYRNRGLASRLINLMFEKCTSLNNITLEVDINNNKAISLYHKLGFSDISIRKKYYLNGNDALLMLKEMN